MAKRRKKILAALALACGLACFHAIAGRGRPADVIFQAEISTSADNTFLIVANGIVQGRTISARTGFTTLTAPLPRKRLSELKLVLGRRPADVTLKKIRLRAFGSQRTLERIQLKKLLQRTSGVERQSLGASGIILQSRGEDAFVILGAEIHLLVEALQRDRLLAVLQSLFFGLLAFAYFAAFDARQPRRFFSGKSLSGIAVAFLLVLFLPLADSLLHFSRGWKFEEKRTMAPPPQLRFDNFWGFPNGFLDYHADHFGCRNVLIGLYAKMQFNLFKVSPHPTVVLGRQGWLYLGQEGETRNVMDYCRCLKPFSAAELEEWRRILCARRDWLARRGIHYLFVFVPDKCTIYPEYLPATIRRMAGSRTRLDQLLLYLRQRSDLDLLDLRPVLLQAKAEYQVYYRTDSHWNWLGAHAGYWAILEKLQTRFPELKPVPLKRFAQKREAYKGDLEVMLALGKDLKEEEVVLVPDRPRLAREMPVAAPPSPWIVWGATEHPDLRLPRAVMIRDSFAHWLMDFLSEHFSHIFYTWDRVLDFDTKLIGREKPDLVIEEMSERFLHDLMPYNPDDIND